MCFVSSRRRDTRCALVTGVQTCALPIAWRFAPLQSGQHAESVIAATAGARSRANEKIKAYRHHGDHLRILKEAGSELCQPIKMIAYLVGGMDGEQADWDAYPGTRATVEIGRAHV